MLYNIGDNVLFFFDGRVQIRLWADRQRTKKFVTTYDAIEALRQKDINKPKQNDSTRTIQKSQPERRLVRPKNRIRI
jgi:hypothetical protein